MYAVADVVALPTNTLVLFGLGALIPPVTAVLTKWHAPDWVKNAVAAVLSIVAAAVTEGIHSYESGAAWTFRGLFLASVITWVTAHLAYAKLWQNTPIMDAVVKKTAGFGVSAKASDWPFPEPKATDLPIEPAKVVAHEGMTVTDPHSVVEPVPERPNPPSTPPTPPTTSPMGTWSVTTTTTPVFPAESAPQTPPEPTKSSENEAKGDPMPSIFGVTSRTKV